MAEVIINYIVRLYESIPTYVYVGLLSLFIIGTIISFAQWGIKRGCKYIMILLLIEYVILLFSTTLIFRSYNTHQVHNFYPLWSYFSMHDGREELLPENIMNVIAFIPIGFLLKVVFHKIRWWHAVLISGGISVIIEISQFVFKRGFAETDDLMHNLLGAIFGYLIYLLVIKRYENRRKKDVI